MTAELDPIPTSGRTHRTRRRLRLSDTDASGRLRLDAVARYLQDAATDDVGETGWGAPEHLWVIRRIRIDVIEPFLTDDEVEVVTWCNGFAAVAAGRRWSLTGDRGGRIEVESVWIHLGPDARPARIENFGPYGETSAGRQVSTKLELPDPPVSAVTTTWPLRVTDVDVLGHVNNAAYWHAVEQKLSGGGPDAQGRLTALLDYRHPIDLGDTVELATCVADGSLDIGFVTNGLVKAVARVTAGGA